MMYKLFVKRDPINLIPSEGRVEFYGQVPEFLSQGPLVIDPNLLKRRLVRSFQDLVIREGDEVFIPPSVYNGYNTKGVPGIWSGNRSALVKNPSTGQLYRIKGAAFGNPPIPRFTDWNGYNEIKDVEGGQFENDADNERVYTNLWNEILKDKGIIPVAEYVGKYIFPFRTNHEGIYRVTDNG